jgi:hypothetical protein
MLNRKPFQNLTLAALAGFILAVTPATGDVTLTYNGSINVTQKTLIAGATPSDPIWSGPNPAPGVFYPGDTITGRLNMPFTGVPYAVVACGTPTTAGITPNDGSISTILTSNNINAQTMIDNGGNGVCSIGISIAIPFSYTGPVISWTTTINVSYI